MNAPLFRKPRFFLRAACLSLICCAVSLTPGVVSMACATSSPDVDKRPALVDPALVDPALVDPALARARGQALIDQGDRAREQGQDAEAVEFYRQAVMAYESMGETALWREIRKTPDDDVISPDLEKLLEALNRLAWQYHLRGDWNAMRMTYRRSFSLAEAQMRRRPDNDYALSDMSLEYDDRGKTQLRDRDGEGARQSFLAEIALIERILPHFNPNAGHRGHLAMAHKNLAMSLIALERYDEAAGELDVCQALTAQLLRENPDNGFARKISNGAHDLEALNAKLANKTGEALAIARENFERRRSEAMRDPDHIQAQIDAANAAAAYGGALSVAREPGAEAVVEEAVAIGARLVQHYPQENGSWSINGQMLRLAGDQKQRAQDVAAATEFYRKALANDLAWRAHFSHRRRLTMRLRWTRPISPKA